MRTQFVKFGFALAVGLLAQAATASVITYETRAIDLSSGIAFDSSTDYRQSWANQGTAVSTQVLPDFSGVKTPLDNYTFSHLSIAFSTSVTTDWTLQLGVDAGYGGAIYLDGVLVESKPVDLWWVYDWANTSQLMTVVSQPLAAGNHVVEGYWAEICCNGGQAARFTADGSTWLTPVALANPVPLPPALWLFATALAGLGVSRIERRPNC
jgi:hypothetical protein